MKKLLFLAVLALAFVGCSSDDDNEDNGDQEEYSIVGVWENSSYFVSFGSDGFYSAYIADEFIDSGKYTKSKNDVSCSNTYFNRNTTYTIKDISDTKIKADVTYTDLYGDIQSKSMTLTKSTTLPSVQNSTLVGKHYSWRSTTFGNITMAFNTFNSGVKSAEKGNALNYPLKFFYVYIGERFYHQILQDKNVQVPSIGGWSTNYNLVRCWELTFSPNGSISGHEVIE